jgi:NAD-dependent SIR2 family protein deacetylase
MLGGGRWGQAQPNLEGLALLELEQLVSQLTLITQNVDSLSAGQLLPALVKAFRA